MAKSCPITNKQSVVGGSYSNRTRATQFNPCGSRRRQVNLVKRRIYVPELDKHITLSLSTEALRTINKNGAYKTLKKAGLI
jgi:large subunit ribosomal protein L28